jgi:hypothetical protein
VSNTTATSRSISSSLSSAACLVVAVLNTLLLVDPGWSGLLQRPQLPHRPEGRRGHPQGRNGVEEPRSGLTQEKAPRRPARPRAGTRRPRAPGALGRTAPANRCPERLSERTTCRGQAAQSVDAEDLAVQFRALRPSHGLVIDPLATLGVM